MSTQYLKDRTVNAPLEKIRFKLGLETQEFCDTIKISRQNYARTISAGKDSSVLRAAELLLENHLLKKENEAFKLTFKLIK